MRWNINRQKTTYILSIILLFLFFLASCSNGIENSATQEKVSPNVLLILADDLGYGDLSCYSDSTKISTPNIDQLALRGIRFTDAHTPSSVCTPTRYGLLTGRYAWRTRLKKKVLWPYAMTLIDKNRKTLPQLFKSQGYQTAMFGKWHLGWDWPVIDSTAYPWEKLIDGNWGGKGLDLSKQIKGGPASAGFDYAFGVDYPNSPPYSFIENGWLVGGVPEGKKPKNMFGSDGLMQPGWRHEMVLPTICNKAKSYLDTASNPFFMYLSLTAPHTPITPSDSFAGKSGAGDYGDFIVEMDTYIGELISTLEKKGQLENTIIIFTSDNGSPAKAGDPNIRSPDWNQFGALERMFGHYPNSPFKDYKSGLYEGGHRVPFIISWPGQIPQNEVSNQLFGLQDLMATFYAFFDQKIPTNTAEDSYDVSPYLFKNQQDLEIRDHIIMHSDLGSFAIRLKDWKLLADSSSGGFSFKYREMLGTYVSDQPGQLYNLSADPYEQEDLYQKNPKKVNELSELLSKYIENSRTAPEPAKD
ncbi:MAG: arylsulfatase [Bacteroidota bacterium]